MTNELGLNPARLCYHVQGKQDLLLRVLEAGTADLLQRLEDVGEQPGASATSCSRRSTTTSTSSSTTRLRLPCSWENDASSRRSSRRLTRSVSSGTTRCSPSWSGSHGGGRRSGNSTLVRLAILRDDQLGRGLLPARWRAREVHDHAGDDFADHGPDAGTAHHLVTSNQMPNWPTGYRPGRRQHTRRPLSPATAHHTHGGPQRGQDRRQRR